MTRRVNLVGALDNIRVVDFGHFVAGPVLGMLLADQGADVIKVDRREGPPYVGPANATWNRGKRSIALDLKDDADLATARSLTTRADIVIENFRPGVMDRLGLSEAELRVSNPGLIYVSIPGFGPEDSRATLPAWEGVVLAATDCFRPAVEYREMVQQLHRKPEARAGSPAFAGEPLASMFAAMIGAVAVAAALRVRDRTGQGQRVTVPLFDAMIQATGVYAMAQLPFKPAYGPAMNPWDHQYLCADDRWLQIVCNRPDHAAALATLLDRPDFIERGMTERRLPNTATEHELILTLNGVFRSRPAKEWEDLLTEHHLPAAMCRAGDEWLVHPQAEESELFIGVDDSELGPTKQPAPLISLSESPSFGNGPAPRIDQDRAAILHELEESSAIEKRATLPISPVLGPLAGIRVLDLGRGLAGPACGRTLAELGADVIKIDDPNQGGVLYHHDVNRAKRSLLLDFETEAGLEIFWDLAEHADVVIENLDPGDTDELGISYDLVKARNSSIVYASLRAYGHEGPWADLPGCEETVQALTGQQVGLGGSDQPAVWPYGMINEYGTGYAAAFGVVLAILERSLTGEGQLVTAASARTAGILQSMVLNDYATKEWPDPSEPLEFGYDAVQSLYQCEDGWIYLGARDARQLEPLLGEIDDDPEDDLIDWCEQRSAADAVEHLVKHGMGAHELTWLNDAMTDPVVVRRGLSVIREHHRIGLLRTTGPGPWFSRSMISAGTPAPSPGADAASILADIDRASELDQLVEDGVIDLPDR